VGKTAIVEGWPNASSTVMGPRPADRQLISLRDMGLMRREIPRSEFEERLKGRAQGGDLQRGQIVAVIDEIHTVVCLLVPPEARCDPANPAQADCWALAVSCVASVATTVD